MKQLFVLLLIVSSCGRVDDSTREISKDAGPHNGCSGEAPVSWSYYQEGAQTCAIIEGVEACIDCEIISDNTLEPQCVISGRLVDGRNYLISYVAGSISVEVNDIPDSGNCLSGCTILHPHESICSDLIIGSM